MGGSKLLLVVQNCLLVQVQFYNPVRVRSQLEFTRSYQVETVNKANLSLLLPGLYDIQTFIYLNGSDFGFELVCQNDAKLNKSIPGKAKAVCFCNKFNISSASL